MDSYGALYSATRRDFAESGIKYNLIYPRTNNHAKHERSNRIKLRGKLRHQSQIDQPAAEEVWITSPESVAGAPVTIRPNLT